MVTVSGRLLDFVEDPSNVAQVQVRAQEVRPHGDGVMLDHPVKVDYAPSTGTVTFDAAAGAAGVIMWHAVGRSHASGSLPLVVPDGDTATLRECVEAVMLADEGTITALERLALEVTGMVATIQNITQLEEWADTARREAADASEDADRAEQARTTSQQIATSLPATISSELDTRVPPMVPPLVADAIAADRAVADAAAAAVEPLAQGAVEAAAEGIKWHKGLIPADVPLDDLYGKSWNGIWSTNNSQRFPDAPEVGVASVTVTTTETGHSIQTYMIPYTGSIYTRSTSLLNPVTWGPWINLTEDQRWGKGLVPSDATLDGMHGKEWEGSWNTDTPQRFSDAPEVGQATIDSQVTSLGYTTQTYRIVTSGNIYTRSTHSLSPVAWTPWVNVLGGQKWYRGAAVPTQLPSLDDAPEGAVSVMSSHAPLYGLPFPGAGFVNTLYAGSLAQQWFTSTVDGAIKMASRTRVGTTWYPWEIINQDDQQLPQPSGGTAEQVISHDLITADARRLVGNRRVTTPAIALVLDHGTNNFHEVILPMLRERGLTCTIALNSQMYDPSMWRYEHDNRTDWSMVAGWWANDGIEIANHGRKHAAGADLESQLEEAIGGMQELAASLPNVPIHSFVTSSAVTEIRDPLDLATTDLGRALWQHHAVIVSDDREREWLLTGEPKQAVWRHWIDKPAQIPGVRSVIESLPPGWATLVSWHPEVMGSGDNHTASDIEAFLDWLVARRDAGDLAVMTLRELSFAQHIT